VEGRKRAEDWAAVHEHNLTRCSTPCPTSCTAGPDVARLEVGSGGGTALELAAGRSAAAGGRVLLPELR